MTQSKEASEYEDFARIISAHEGPVRAFIAVRLDDPFEAHDLAQEVFLTLWRRLKDIDLDQPLRPWLLGVATNLIRDHRRKRRPVPIGGNDEVFDLLNHGIEEDQGLDGPAFAALEHCLEKLDSEAQRLVQWRYRDGLDIREIRQRSGSKHSAVTMKLHRLRSLLLGCVQLRLKETTP
ncbi:MAG: sigma-70 family RNA polymerase sigma factor [Verrucomicrobiota bacterium]